ncbi:MAG: hypothetical protein ABL933_09650, partial [Methyloglobulus sp.]
TITRKGEQLNVLVQPAMSGGIDNFAPEDIQNLRAALSMPLYVTTTPEVLDNDFPRSLAEFAGMQEQVQGDLSAAMGRIKEAGKQARAEVKTSTPSVGTGKNETLAVDTEKEPEAAKNGGGVTVTNNSLF